ncbi:glycine cleavage system aminomethyltransferase GcvT [Salibacterium aidingense]|uniref:glycine cleavage system aminomethyltransferase GcvT n=1 Tax=Salibacterium aidingense TaxID=384933 RepID=UPI00047B81AA|nr:glycine cleavage system aminomethyltransferase GcvT [Salibacterium aidingense]
MSHAKRTPLYSIHHEYGAKIVEFGGWEMPVYFSGIKKEHHTVRKAAGLFDVSHMGEARVTGSHAFSWLQTMVTNDLATLEPGKAMYTLLCNERGGVVDDMLVYQLAAEDYFLVLNAANTSKDINWLQSHAKGEVSVKNVSDEYALLALQGPKAETVLQRISREDLSSIAPFRFQPHSCVNDVSCLVSRTGYTGEDGFEIYCPVTKAEELWKAVLEAGEPEGVIPCGLGARDTLRMEARLPLYGQEIDETISPLEAGLGFAVKLQKDSPFIGKEALEEEKAGGPARRLIGLKMIDKGIPRSGCTVLNEKGESIGEITTGTHSPTLAANVGMALVEIRKETGRYYVQIRRKTLEAAPVSLPFYKKS